jgi:hypothetical protein
MMKMERRCRMMRTNQEYIDTIYAIAKEVGFVPGRQHREFEKGPCITIFYSDYVTLELYIMRPENKMVGVTDLWVHRVGCPNLVFANILQNSSFALHWTTPSGGTIIGLENWLRVVYALCKGVDNYYMNYKTYDVHVWFGGFVQAVKEMGESDQLSIWKDKETGKPALLNAEKGTAHFFIDIINTRWRINLHSVKKLKEHVSGDERLVHEISYEICTGQHADNLDMELQLLQGMKKVLYSKKQVISVLKQLMAISFGLTVVDFE